MSRNLKTIFTIIGLLVALTVAGCAGYNRPASYAKPTTAPPADTARIFFIKPGGSMGNAEVFILEEDKVVGYLQNRQCFFVDVPAGEHLYMSVTSNADGLKATVDGGKTYYVRLFSTPGAMSLMMGGSENIFIAAIERDGEMWDKRAEYLDGCRLMEMNPEKVAKWEANYAERNTERLTNFKSGAAESKTMGPEDGE